jgi:adenosylcobyric acid synthase
MLARTVMIQGTASSVGKSLLVAGLCRMLRQDGLSVAPFKAQNMALNADVTADGGEIGRAQAVQAEAAGIAPSIDMNPILLKPEGDARSQVIVLGRSVGSLGAREYHERKPELRGIVAGALARLRAAHDVVVIEGAGSPAEINLRDRDIVNMYVAGIAGAPVVLVGDIDRGGVFAALVGTIELLEPADRAKLAGLVINKFRGELALLRPGLEFLEQRSGIPVLGVVPFIPKLRIADEDSVSLDEKRTRPPARRCEIEVAVVKLPRISNFDDFEPLEHEPGVVVRFVDRSEDIALADLVIVPGSKSTIADLGWLRDSGLAGAIQARAHRGQPVLGICGGCQVLGERVEDPDRLESTTSTSCEGLGLLGLRTRFSPGKVTAKVVARPLGRGFFAAELAREERLFGYQIHMGRLEAVEPDRAPLEIVEFAGNRASQHDGGVSADGAVVGTMIHGLFESAALRAALVTALARRKGLSPSTGPEIPSKEREYDRLARALRESLDTALLARIVGL